jgi:hypothetical protein
MNTTTVLLENLIQGFQTILWIGLLALSCIDITAADVALLRANATMVKSVLFASIFLGACYWLGLIVDTAYYHVFIQRSEKRWFEAKRRTDEPNLLDMALVCMSRSADIAALLKERQAHLRMFRVSMVNVAFITIGACVFTVTKLSDHRWLVFGICVTTGAAIFAVMRSVWRHLYGFYVTLIQTGYRVIRDHPSLATRKPGV